MMGWTPAFAGMTDDEMDSCLCGNDGLWDGFPPLRDWQSIFSGVGVMGRRIPACAGMRRCHEVTAMPPSDYQEGETGKTTSVKNRTGVNTKALPKTVITEY